MKIKAVIFDLDGTITEPFLDFEAIRREIGLSPEAGTLLEAMEKMLPDARRRAMDIIERHEEIAVRESRLNDGAEFMLNKLRNAGIKIGILTRNKRSNAIAISRKHAIEFDAIYDRDDGPVKPDAFGVLKLCGAFRRASFRIAGGGRLSLRYFGRKGRRSCRRTLEKSS